MSTATAVSRPPELDPAEVQEVVAQLLAALNGGALSFLLSLGHRTGLLDALAAAPGVTSVELARRTGLTERYVREVLDGLVAGRVVQLDPARSTYTLPPAYAALLTRGTPLGNVAVAAGFFSVLGSVEDRIVDCFREGGGVPYEAYPRFHEVMAEESKQTVVDHLESDILPLVPGLVDRLRQGIEVLDVGCGRGMALERLARSFPASRFLGIDLSGEAIAFGRDAARRAGLRNLQFEARDVTRLGLEGRFQLITAFDAIHDQKHPAKVLSGIASALTPDGVFLMQDIGVSSAPERNREHPLGAYMYTISCMHCMTVSLAQGGDGLGAAWGVELAEAMLREAGFSEITTHRLPHDILNCYFVARRG